MSKRSNPPKAPADAGADKQILDELVHAGIPLAPAELSDRLAIKRAQRPAFEAAIQALIQRGKVIANRRGDLCLATKLDLVTGTVIGHPDGFGFISVCFSCGLGPMKTMREFVKHPETLPWSQTALPAGSDSRQRITADRGDLHQPIPGRQLLPDHHNIRGMVAHGT